MKKIVLIIVAVIVSGAIFSYLKIGQVYRNIYKPKAIAPTLPPEKTEYNILLLGYGGGTHEGGLLTDTMMLAHFNTKTKKALLISVPRDSWVKLPTKSGSDFHMKINSAYQIENEPQTYPDVISENLAKKVVQQVTGLVVDNQVVVDFDSFKTIIDTIGGVDVNVQKTFDDYEYPVDGKENDLCGKDEQFKQIEQFLKPGYSEEEKTKLITDKPDLGEFLKNITDDPALAFPCRYEHLHFDQGLTHMDGTTALKYVRSRHGLQDGSDFGRAARQQQFIQAVKNKVLNLSFIPKILPLVDQFQNNISMDISPEEIQKLLIAAKDANQYTIDRLVISNSNYLTDSYSTDGQYILAPKEGADNWSGVKTAINNTILGITPIPTATASGTLKKTNGKQ